MTISTVGFGANGIERIGEGSPSGSDLGVSATDKIGMYGATPVVQASTIALVATTVATTSAYGFTSAQANAIVADVNAIVTALSAQQGGIGLIA
jgi:hypothetical protein